MPGPRAFVESANRPNQRRAEPVSFICLNFSSNTSWRARNAFDLLACFRGKYSPICMLNLYSLTQMSFRDRKSADCDGRAMSVMVVRGRIIPQILLF